MTPVLSLALVMKCPKLKSFGASVFMPGKTEQDPVAAKLGDADRTHQDDFCTPNAVRTEVARP